jgi:hypothetical protein
VPSKPLTLELFFRRACYRRNASYRKMKIINVVEKIKIYRFGSVHFLVHDSSKDDTELAKRSKVRGFYGMREVNYLPDMPACKHVNKRRPTMRNGEADVAAEEAAAPSRRGKRRESPSPPHRRCPARCGSVSAAGTERWWRSSAARAGPRSGRRRRSTTEGTRRHRAAGCSFERGGTSGSSGNT